MAESRLLVFGTVSFYMVAAIVMITVNKWVLIDTNIPITFITLQLLLSAVFLEIIKRLGFVDVGAIHLDTAKKLWPLIVTNAASIAVGNLCLRYVDASFYQVARGLVLPATVMLALAAQANPPSKMAIVSCVIVTIGFLIGCSGLSAVGGKGEKGVTGIGVLFGLASSLITAYHAILIKRSLPIVDGSALRMAYYCNIFSALCMVPVILITGEFAGVHAVATGKTDARTLIFGTILTGFFGFLIGIAGLLSVKVTSPVSHMVSSAARGVLQTIVSVIAFHEIITHRRMISISVIIAGSCHYVWVKHQEQQAAAASTKPSSLAADEEAQIPLVATNGGKLEEEEDEDEELERELAEVRVDRALVGDGNRDKEVA